MPQSVKVEPGRLKINGKRCLYSNTTLNTKRGLHSPGRGCWEKKGRLAIGLRLPPSSLASKKKLFFIEGANELPASRSLIPQVVQRLLSKTLKWDVTMEAERIEGSKQAKENIEKIQIYTF
jgi:hypothetical protein